MTDDRPPTDDRYLTLAALVEYSGLSLRTLMRHLHAADRPLPHYRIGNRVMVLRSEFDAWVRGARVQTTPRDATFDQKVAEAAASLRRR